MKSSESVLDKLKKQDEIAEKQRTSINIKIQVLEIGIGILVFTAFGFIMLWEASGFFAKEVNLTVLNGFRFLLLYLGYVKFLEWVFKALKLDKILAGLKE